MNDNPFFTHEGKASAEECPPQELPADPPVQEGIPPVAEQPEPVPSAETVTYDRPVAEPTFPREPTPRPEGPYGRGPYYGRSPYEATQPGTPAGQQPYYGRMPYGQGPVSPNGATVSRPVLPTETGRTATPTEAAPTAQCRLHSLLQILSPRRRAPIGSWPC